MNLPRLVFILLVLAATVGGSEAATEEEVRAAVERGLTLVTRAASNWQKNKTCFSCHHQTLPMLAAVEAGRAGFPLDRAWLQSQAATTHEYFAERIEDMDEGDHVPGGAATTAYGFWALSLGGRTNDATTTAMVNYLLQIQGVQRLKPVKISESAQPRDGRWIASCRRAPMQASEIGDTVLTLIGLAQYAAPEQQSRFSAAREQAEKYLAGATLRTHQDRLWRWWGLHRLGGDDTAKSSVLAEIFRAQRPDGGWGQMDNDLESDAYSTGQTLFMLCRSVGRSDQPAILRARDYLIKAQQADGSWRVESRVKFKAQPYFENGDPHGEHQFLSTAAACWATAGLSQLLPRRP